jgi:hypothetical protein
MGSLALPALDLKPPQQQPSPLEQFGNLLQLKNALQEQPLRQQALQQNIQQGALDVQQKQTALKDQQAMTQAMHDWDGKDVNQLIPLVIKNGASANAVMGLKSKVLEQQQTYSTIAKNDAATGASNLATLKGKNDEVAGALTNLLDPKAVPDDQLPQAVLTTAQQLAQQGLLDPQHLQMAQHIAQSGDPTAIRQQLGLMQKGLMSQSQQIDEAAKQATIVKGQAETAQAAANAQETHNYHQQEIGVRKAELGQGAQRLGIEGARLAFQKAQAGVTPNGTPSPLAAAIAKGQIPLDRMGYLLSKNPGLIQGVLQVDPSFDGSKAAAYPGVYKEFTSSKPGTAGGALNAGGAALQHMNELSQMNTAESHIPGTADYNAYMNKADTVASELARFYGTDTVSGIGSIKKTLTATLPGQRQAAIETQAKSMGDKLDSYQQTWQNAAPSKAYEAPMPGLSAKAIAARAALDPGSKASASQLTVPAPNGKTYSFKDQASADAFKAKAGIQ